MFADAVKKLSLSVTPGFKALLAKNKHGTDRAAPKDFQALIESLKPARFELSAGFSCEFGYFEFVWTMNGIAFDGEPGAVTGQINRKLAALGFTPAGNDREPEFRKEGRDFSVSFAYEPLQRHVGARKAACGTRFTYTASFAGEAEKPTFSEAVSAYPQISCPELAKPIIDKFADNHVGSMFYGGTWTDYYSFDCSFSYFEKSMTYHDLDSIEAVLSGLGYAREDGADDQKGASNATFTYKMENMGTYIWLEVFEETRLEFRFQPHS